MRYFSKLPLTVGQDNTGRNFILRNIMARAEMIQDLKKNVQLFYDYSIQDGDTPESVAYKYYGDQYRYWIVLYSNGILDPQWEWPLTSNQFELYLNEKYKTIAEENGKTVLEYTNTTIHHYEKLIITIDGDTLYQTTKNVIVDEETYNNTNEKTEQSTINGVTVNYTIGKRMVSLYDYEIEQNESKRQIKLIDKVYAAEMERQFEKLMNK